MKFRLTSKGKKIALISLLVALPLLGGTSYYFLRKGSKEVASDRLQILVRSDVTSIHQSEVIKHETKENEVDNSPESDDETPISDSSKVPKYHKPFHGPIKLKYKDGKRYALCGRYDRVHLYDKIDGVVISELPFCLEVKFRLGPSLLYEEVKNENADWLKIKSAYARDRHNNISGFYYARKDELITPYVLTDGQRIMPISFPAPISVKISKELFLVTGETEPCQGVFVPQLEFMQELTEGVPLVDGFEVDKAQIVKIIRTDLSECESL